MALVCYHGETPHRIDQDRASEIVKVMLDSTNRKIITCIKDDAKNIIQIQKETNIPTSTIYRRLCTLNNKRLIILSGDINSDGRKFLKYKSKIRKVVTIVEDDVLDVKIFSNLKD